MGYLDNSTVTVDAILTLKGRQLLAQGSDAFKITQFALGDDEIDYSLWNTDHPLGTDYYGIIIENMPIVEASPDETQALRSKLITLPPTTQYIPVINVGVSSFTFDSPAKVLSIVPTTSTKGSTTALSGANKTYGYTVILSDSSIANITVTKAISAEDAPTAPSFAGDSTSISSISAIGLEFKITPKVGLSETKVATVTIFANETGGSVTVPITVNKNLGVV
jgi:hypothetical protein